MDRAEKKGAITNGPSQKRPETDDRSGTIPEHLASTAGRVRENTFDDHPHALPNYRQRGFGIYREEALSNPLSGPAGASSHAG